MKSSTVLALLAVTALATGAACSSSSSSAPDEPTVVASNAARITTPNVPAADAEALRAGNTAFATDFYRQLASAPTAANQNVFFSPYSISLALAMTYAGAKGETATQMASALHFTLPQAQLHTAFDGLDLALMSRGANATSATGGPFRLSVANSLWGAKELTFGAPFLDTLAQDYGSGMRVTDFRGNADGARVEINRWVSAQTQDKINDLLVPGTIDPSTAFVLVNAIYFNASWATPFEKQATRDDTFHGAKSDATTSFMAQETSLPYAKGDGYQAVALPYQGNELSLVAVLPDDLAAFESSLSDARAKSIADSLVATKVDLMMPKVKIAGDSVSLAATLKKLGMTDAFTAAADLSGITTSAPIAIADVIHKAYVSIDEDGTEAAAATAVIAEAGVALPPPDLTRLTLDRPFVFFVRDNATGAILFLGRFVQP